MTQSSTYAVGVEDVGAWELVTRPETQSQNHSASTFMAIHTTVACTPFRLRGRPSLEHTVAMQRAPVLQVNVHSGATLQPAKLRAASLSLFLLHPCLYLDSLLQALAHGQRYDEKVVILMFECRGSKIPSRPEGQLEQSVDSFQLAKTQSRTNPH